ncbi:hypothetical protein AOL_s00083g427 [Orbilia oligospora ATCC 24927]|uniref:DUF155 domain-containing protein n=1 Tax=Arthrobotrys oligospora (strain ATCC 24927 / CBS 115.81 / DSM 1491) TaxID=756982 RepID=G1XHE6_ARTOA|nr:hypothetical protein AOL_s00083g427 [Orbilia oligospora ATCC 24927]EGX47491.1 hypothetical protein AOL_s00083g427 [Orbilia oligospora ATCC 24927]
MSALRATRRLLTAAVPGRTSRPSSLSSSSSSLILTTHNRTRLLHLKDRTTLRTFNSTASLQKVTKREDSHEEKDNQPSISSQFEKKSNTRSTAAKSRLRQAANVGDRNKNPTVGSNDDGKLPAQICTAYCTAEKYNLIQCNSLLKSGGYVPDPLSTGLGEEVIHLRLPLPPQAYRQFPKLGADSYGDIFIFPSGNIVSWGIPEAVITAVAALIRPAAENPHSTTETETLEFVEDPNRHTSFLRGDIIMIGTGINKKLDDEHHHPLINIGSIDSIGTTLNERKVVWQEDEEEGSRHQNTPTVLAKIAFSSGMARSTKLAVLEEMLENYIESTSMIPELLSQGSRLPFTRSFILRKTGELLSFRARLNLYSELTDNLPDIFWDSRKELGLEGYYESIGRELDVGVRIRKLNEKLDYASEMAAVLRERLSERHGLVLEWMIIILITIEVGFEILHLWKDSKTEQRWEEEMAQEYPPQRQGYPPPAPPSPQQHPQYPGYPRYDHHQHHLHRHPPYQHHPGYQSSYPPIPQTPYQQQLSYHTPPANEPLRKMDDVDTAIALLDVIISRITSEERERGRKERQTKQEEDDE